MCKRELEQDLVWPCGESENNWHKKLQGSSKSSEYSSDDPSAWNDAVRCDNIEFL